MTQSRSRAVSQETWVGHVILAWVVTVLAADLKVSVDAHIHWAITAFAALLILPYLNRVGWKVKFPARTPAWILIIAVCVPVLYGASVMHSLIEAAKIAAILLLALSIFVARSRLTHWAFRGFVVAVFLNLILLVGGFLGFGSAEIMALDRWGTILNYPGSLWRAAITVWVFAAYLSIKQRSFVSLALMTASSVLVYADGARTGILILLAGALFLVFVLSAEAGRLRRALMVSGVGIGLVVLAVAFSGIVSAEPDNKPEGVLERVAQLSASVEEGGYEGLQTADVIRFQMLQDVVAAIRSHPLLGTGIETTTTETYVGPMAVHMTYLQVWADLGALGLIAYVWLVWGWIGSMPSALRTIRSFSDPARRAIYYNALFLLLVYALIGFFHPLSTEWSEWIMFVVPYALVYEVIHRNVGFEKGGLDEFHTSAI
jgi:O-antigen ligase